jgi:SAM-dependent methyltransferase
LSSQSTDKLADHMKPLGTEYVELLRSENNFGAPHAKDTALFLSSVTCTPMDDSISFGPEYWVDNLTSPVRFNSAITNLKVSGKIVFLEVGPHSTLAGPLRDISSTLSRPWNYIPCQIRNQDGTITFLSAVGRLYEEAFPIDIKALFSDDRQALNGLPVYPWDHNGSYWYESRLSSAWRQRPFPHHSLLGERTVDSPDFSPIWRNMLSLEDVPWIADHRIGQDVVFPLAGYIAMAGEAIRQTTRIDTGYHLRDVQARRGLVLTDSKTTEVLTVLHAHTGAAAEAPSWYDFSIASCQEDSWLIHCTGQVSPLAEDQTQKLSVLEALPRKLTPMRFYEAMARVGVVFGPEFQRLEDITSSVTIPLAEAQVVSPVPPENKKVFTLHPVVIDSCIQLLIVAAARGLCRNLDQLEVPVVVGNVEVFGGAANLRARAHNFTKGVECVTEDSKLAMRMSGLRLAPLAAEETDLADIHAGARLQWLPDFDFVDHRELFDKPQRPLLEIELEERLTLLCVLESIDKVTNISPCHPHLAKYREWLTLQVCRAEAGEYTLVEHARELIALPREERQNLIVETYAKILGLPGLHAYSVGIKRICDHADQIFKGEADTLELLMQDDILSELYDSVSFGYGEFVRLLSSNRANIRVLEVGAGTGGTTEQTLRGLIDGSNLPPYSVYTFTDVSAGFFPQAKERFAYAPNMEYKTFDISKDGLAQGFEAASYDLILAPNVVHATPSLKTTLSNLESLLKADGFLIMSELCSLIQSPNYIFGNFVGWWLGEADGRNWEPYVQPERWDADLKAAGFTGVDAFVPDQDVPSHRIAATIISQPARKINMPGNDKAVTLLCQSMDADIVIRLQSHLQDGGWQVDKCRLGENMPFQGRDIIATVGLESAFFGEDLTPDQLVVFQALLRHLDAEKVLWLCPPFQVQCKDPQSAQTLGIARTVRTELSIPFFTMEIDTKEGRFEELVHGVFQKMRTTKDEASLHAEKEFVVTDGRICIGRYQSFELKKELPSSVLTLDSAAAYLIVGGTGGLGRSMATWMIEHGATNLIMLSRRAGKGEESHKFSHELHEMGCSVQLIAGSVENPDDVRRAIASTRKAIKGVFQLAMVLKVTLLLSPTDIIQLTRL